MPVIASWLGARAHPACTQARRIRLLPATGSWTCRHRATLSQATKVDDKRAPILEQCHQVGLRLSQGVDWNDQIVVAARTTRGE